MFARSAKIRDPARVFRDARTPLGHSNDNQAKRSLIATTDSSGGRALVCHWRVNPASGKPECHWALEGDAPADCQLC
jgi:hypothetical protein